MGLRFRKSVTLCKGVKLNFGKTGASITTGVKGFHKTYNFNTGKTTTSVGIPGTGIYYTDTSGGKKKAEKQAAIPNSNFSTPKQTGYIEFESAIPSQPVSAKSPVGSSAPITETKPVVIKTPKTISDDTIDAIYRVCDEKIDWFEFLSSHEPTNEWVSKDIWQYLHSASAKVCSGDYDAMLDVIETLNPFDDLLEYCSNFECGFDDEECLKIGFELNSTITASKELKKKLVDSCIIRIARDAFALLPIDKVNVGFYEKNVKTRTYSISANTFGNIPFRFASAANILEKL